MFAREEDDECETEAEGENIEETEDETEEDESETSEDDLSAEDETSDGEDEGRPTLAGESTDSPPPKRSRKAPTTCSAKDSTAKDREIATLRKTVARLRLKVARIERVHRHSLSFMAGQASALQEHLRVMAMAGISHASRSGGGS